MTKEITFEDLHELPAAGEFISDAAIDTPEETQIRKDYGGAIANNNTVARFEEKCKSCRGSGDFISYAGRYVGKCFKCKGTGKRSFKTSPETRAKAKDRAATKKVAREDAKKADADQYAKDNADMIEYLNEVSGWNSFAANMIYAINEFGSLTSPQKGAVEKMQAKHVAKKAADKEQATDGIDLTDLPAGTYAVPGGDTRLKIAVRRPAKNSKWYGWTFVDDGSEYGKRQNYGRQAPGKNYVGNCVDQLTAIAADPKAAMAAYGKLTGTCGMCGRHLEDEKSVEIGIGPVCLTKF